MERVILFDGVCNFCNSSVQFIMKRDPEANYRFTSLQSDTGQRLLENHDIPLHLDSVIYLEKGKVYYKSTAALRVCRNLKGLWRFMYIFIIVPRPLRDMIYDFIARNRYKWFGKRDACKIPTPEERDRFLD